MFTDIYEDKHFNINTNDLGRNPKTKTKFYLLFVNTKINIIKI